MEELDIKQIWKGANKKELLAKSYSLDDIQKYRKRKSHLISKSSRLTIFFDIGYKSVTLIGLIYLLTVLNHQEPYQIIIGSLMAVTASLVLIEINFIEKLKSIKETDSVIDNLQNKLIFLKTTYNQFIFLSALSNPLFVLAGFLLYHHFKYNGMHTGTPMTDPVTYIFLVIAFAISFFSQKPIYNTQIKELQESIHDMNDTAMASIKIEENKKRKRNNIILCSILILIGVLFLLLTLIK